MTSKSCDFILILLIIIIFIFHGCNKKSGEIPPEFKNYISQISTPVDYKEITPSHDSHRFPIPAFITKQQALEDIEMFEYLLSTSYSGFEYWKHNGVDFKSFFKKMKAFVSAKDSLSCYEFENELSKILKQIRDGHIALIGTGYNQAYMHKAVYYCDILVEKTNDGLFKVIDSHSDLVEKGDLFNQQNPGEYLFKTLSPTGKNHYLIGVFSFDTITSRKLLFNGKMIHVPFHGSRLRYAKFNDPEPFYIKWENDIPVVRITSFADKLYPQMKKFMNSAIELRNENTIIVNLFNNGGGSSVFPQAFIQYLDGAIEWETQWATLNSPAITEYYSKLDLNSISDISSNYRNLISSHKKIYEDYRRMPVKNWEFDATYNQNVAGNYNGKLILLTNRRVLSAGEGMVGISRSLKNSIIIGENTGGSAQFSSTCGYYLPHSKFIAHIPRQFILIPGLEECIGYIPDYWLDTIDPLKEVLNWLDDPAHYQFKYSGSYEELTKKIHIFPILPKDTKIIKPGSKVPKSLQAFSGKWFGVADGVLDHVLVVEKIKDNLEVNAIYSWGVAYQWNINQPGWKRYVGKFKNQKLILTEKNKKTKITYMFNPDGTLDSIYERPGIFSRTKLTRINN